MLYRHGAKAIGALLLVAALPACSNAPASDEPAGVGAGGQATAGVAQQPAGATQGGTTTLPTGGAAGQAPSGVGSAGQSGSPPEMPAACDPSALVCDSSLPLPATIKKAGFFPSAPDFTHVAAALTLFQPSLELWSNGLGKMRFVLLPQGTKIDNQDRERWAPPVGAIFIKQFFADGPDGASTRPIETRLIRRTSDPDPLSEYEFAVYRWNDAGTDATLLDPFWDAVSVPLAVSGQSLTHVIPSRSDCDKCHAANDTKIIGFDELRLNSKLPGAAMTQLEALAAMNAFKVALPTDPARISVPADPVLEQVEGFVQGNCAHCHNGLDSSVFDLRYPTFVQNTVGQMTMGSGTNQGLRVDPGKPDSSILYRQVTRVMLPPGLNPMPPVGVQRASDEGIALLRKWILALPPT